MKKTESCQLVVYKFKAIGRPHRPFGFPQQQLKILNTTYWYISNLKIRYLPVASGL